MLETIILAVGGALLEELRPLLEKVVQRVMDGENPLDAIDAERVGEVLPHPLKLALVRALERERRHLPPDPTPAPTTP